MAETVTEVRARSWRRVRSVSLFAICLITLTALLELGLVAKPYF